MCLSLKYRFEGYFFVFSYLKVSVVTTSNSTKFFVEICSNKLFKWSTDVSSTLLWHLILVCHTWNYKWNTNASLKFCQCQMTNINKLWRISALVFFSIALHFVSHAKKYWIILHFYKKENKGVKQDSLFITYHNHIMYWLRLKNRRLVRILVSFAPGKRLLSNTFWFQSFCLGLM